jgi:lipoprotein NlpI
MTCGFTAGYRPPLLRSESQRDHQSTDAPPSGLSWLLIGNTEPPFLNLTAHIPQFIGNLKMIFNSHSQIVRFLFGIALLCNFPDASCPGDEKAKKVKSDDSDVQRVEVLNSQLKESLTIQLREKGSIDAAAADAVDQYSARGDLQMFLGEFEKAESDYLQMVKLKPELDTSHWRLGIAMFFANHPKLAAEQFDKYNSFDNVDRENGIWRYLSHYRAFGKEEAKRQLLRYEKDDRPPFKEVYRLFDGTLTASEVLQAIPADLRDESRDSRLFYSHLYIGMNEVVEGQAENATASLLAATLNTWPRKAGYGPNYMWHIGRLQYIELQKARQAE